MGRYVSYYVLSNGQPENGHREHTNKAEAIRRARRLRDALTLRAGGKAVAFDLDHCVTVYEWREHAEGGYRLF